VHGSSQVRCRSDVYRRSARPGIGCRSSDVARGPDCTDTGMPEPWAATGPHAGDSGCKTCRTEREVFDHFEGALGRPRMPMSGRRLETYRRDQSTSLASALKHTTSSVKSLRGGCAPGRGQPTVGSWHFPMDSLDRPQPKIPQFPTPTNHRTPPTGEYASASVLTAPLIGSGELSDSFCIASAAPWMMSGVGFNSTWPTRSNVCKSSSGLQRSMSKNPEPFDARATSIIPQQPLD
jgi:hypothetical protein